MRGKSREATPPVSDGAVWITQFSVEAAPQIVDVTFPGIELNRQVEELHRLVATLQLYKVFALIAKRSRRFLLPSRKFDPPPSQHTQPSNEKDAHHSTHDGDDEAECYIVPSIPQDTFD